MKKVPSKKSMSKKKMQRNKNLLIIGLLFVFAVAVSLHIGLSKNAQEYRVLSNAQTASSGWLSGASSINKNHNEFAAWRGSPVTIAGVWSDATAADQENQWAYLDYANFSGNLDLSVGSIYPGESFGAMANGAYDARFKKALKIINDNWGSKKTIFLRFSHEFNGNWYNWSVTSANAEDFKRAFRHFHALVQSELVAKGKDAKVVWSPNDASKSNARAEAMWPGDQYVDVVGVDSYDWWPHRDESNWTSALNARDSNGDPRGIELWRQFAQAHGKPLAFPEWGCDPSGVYDNPYYIKKMNEYFRQHAGTGPGQVLYEIYFNAWDSDRIYPTTSVPNAQAMYKSLKWGDGGISNTTPVTPVVTQVANGQIPTEVPENITPTMYCGGSGYCVPSPSISDSPDAYIPPTGSAPDSYTTPTQDNTNPDSGSGQPNQNNGNNQQGEGRGPRNSQGFFQQFLEFLISLLEAFLNALRGNR